MDSNYRPIRRRTNFPTMEYLEHRNRSLKDNLACIRDLGQANLMDFYGFFGQSPECPNFFKGYLMPENYKFPFEVSDIYIVNELSTHDYNSFTIMLESLDGKRFLGIYVNSDVYINLYRDGKNYTLHESAHNKITVTIGKHNQILYSDQLDQIPFLIKKIAKGNFI